MIYNYNYMDDIIRELILITYLMSNITIFVYLLYTFGNLLYDSNISIELLYFFFFSCVAGIVIYFFGQYYLTKAILLKFLKHGYIPFIFKAEINEESEWTESYLCYYTIPPILLTEILFIHDYFYESIIVGAVLTCVSIIVSLIIPDKPILTKKIFCMNTSPRRLIVY